jgi:hypothetical protein
VYLQDGSPSNKAIYFLRTNPNGVEEKTVELDVFVGELGAAATNAYHTLASELYHPILKETEAAAGMDIGGFRDKKFTEVPYLTRAILSELGGLLMRVKSTVSLTFLKTAGCLQYE